MSVSSKRYLFREVKKMVGTREELDAKCTEIKKQVDEELKVLRNAEKIMIRQSIHKETMMDKIDKCFIAVILILIIGCAVMQLWGCSARVQPQVAVKPETQLTKQDVKDVIADVVKQSSQNGLFNFQFDDGTVVALIGIVFAGGLAASFTRKGVTYGVGTIRRKRQMAKWNTDPTGQSGRDN